MKIFFLAAGLIGAIFLFRSEWWKQQLRYIELGSRLRINEKRIERSKKLLEENIVDMPYVTGVNTRPYSNNSDVIREGVESYIEVAVDSESKVEEIKQLILCPADGRFQGFETKIVVQPAA